MNLVVLGLSCGGWAPQLWHANSQLRHACGMQFPGQRLNPGPLHWKHRVFFFFFGCVESLLLRTGYLQLQQAGDTLRCGARASHGSVFSYRGAWALGTQASVVVARGLSSCGAWASLLCGMWDLPEPGLKHKSPALVGGVLTTAPPGESLLNSL